MASLPGGPESRATFGGVIGTFEDALNRGERPEIGSFLSQSKNLPLLIELIHVEMEFNLKKGEDASVAQYLIAYPEISQDRTALAELIEAEYKFRFRLDPSLDRATFLNRYSEYAKDLAGLMQSKIDQTDPPFFQKALDGEGTVSGVAQPGQIIAGRYTLIRKIGEGGMGEVWVASQVDPIKRQVALKLIKPGMDSRAVIQRFEQERQALALMDHPNIAKVLDGGLTKEQRPFFVMELVDGLSLNRFCDQEKLGIPERLELFVSICQAVQHAHQKGIVHRDLKPSNILVAWIDGKATPKVIDFGVVKAVGGKLLDEVVTTQIGLILGTLEYMSPEQATFNGAQVDTRSDIYSLGVVLYELLTGLRPFDANRLKKAAFDESMRVIREEEPARPSTRLSTSDTSPSLAAIRRMEPGRLTRLLRGELDWLVMKCLEKQPDRRYVTANALARDVQRFLANETVEARPPSATYRAQKYLQRNAGFVVSVGFIGLAILGGLGGTAWGLIQAERSKAQADIDRQTAMIKQNANDQINQYLVQTFQSADPVGLESSGFQAPGVRSDSALTRKILDNGAQLAREHLKDQPLVLAKLLDAMGNSYRNLGAWDSAHELLREGYELRRSHLGEESQDSLISLQSLAHLERDRGNYAEADKLYRKVISLREKALSPNQLLVAETKAYLAWMTFYRPLSIEGPQFDQKRLEEAEKLLLEVLKVRTDLLPPNHRDIGFTLAALASIKLGQPNQELAVLTYASRAAIVFQNSDQDTQFGSAFVELINAEQHRKAKRWDQAEKGQLKVLAQARQYLGPKHPLVLLQLASLAGLYRQKGDANQAEKYLLEMFDLARPLPYFRNQPVVVDAFIQYADEVRKVRSPTAASALYREALVYARERPQGNEKNLAALTQRLKDLDKKDPPEKK